MPIKVLIADDDALVREGLKVILQVDDRFEVVACVANGRDAVEVCARKSVDVALLDVRMPVMDGLAAAAEISRRGTRALMLTTFDNDELVTGAIASGARGYLLKSSTPERIKDAIRIVADGGSVIQDAAMDKLKERLASSPPPPRIDESIFSEREREVVKAIATGQSNKEIAEKLFISEGTVKNHVSAILDKTGLDHRTQIAIWYLTGKTPP
jgi:DNA-binding NarL/FixJ family response regulator